MGDVVHLGGGQQASIMAIGGPMLTEHKARLEFARADIGFGEVLVEALGAYHPIAALSPLGRVQATVTFLARDIAHATDMALVIADEVADASLVALEAMKTGDFDRLYGGGSVPGAEGPVRCPEASPAAVEGRSEWHGETPLAVTA